jgi:uncharacterized membrane protein/plastocyanin
MDPVVSEWLHLVLRWVHVIAAIAWIGHAFLFNWLDSDLVPPDDPAERDRTEGELFMVHGGGFYRVEKSYVYPQQLRGPLHWFKWEAAATWLSGFFLLWVVYYMGGGVYLVDPSVSDISVSAATALGIGLLVVSWLVYDLVLCASPLARNDTAFGVVGFALIVGVAWGLTQILSGRAAFIHVGAMLGTLMAANVWVRIIPNMRRMIDGATPGQPLNRALGGAAKFRSKHNNYFVYPLVFIMISNHYPRVYAHEYSWLLLAGIMGLGGGIKFWMNHRGERAGIQAAGVVTVLGAIVLWAWGQVDSTPVEKVETSLSDLRPIDESTVGVIRGEVLLEGEAPAPRELTLFNGCESSDGEPVFDEAIRVQDGRVEGTFVWLKSGWEDWQVPAPPTTEAVIDQQSCIYVPRISGVRVGQPVTFLNSDALLHNVRAVTDTNPTFNDLMPQKDQRLTKVFKRPDVMLQAKCDIHPWMATYLGVVPHPWFAVTDKQGAFTIPGVPPGTYEVEFWHEIFGRVTKPVTLGDGENLSVDVRLQAP